MTTQAPVADVNPLFKYSPGKGKSDRKFHYCSSWPVGNSSFTVAFLRARTMSVSTRNIPPEAVRQVTERGYPENPREDGSLNRQGNRPVDEYFLPDGTLIYKNCR
jgi:hypothetical protein